MTDSTSTGMTGGEVLVAAVAANGIDTVFGVPGATGRQCAQTGP
jgi:thiamine pyrophosphate-dependent acetolactate synthase large subunit-like protein